MDIVDINVNIYKYIQNTNKKRNVTWNNNISYWICMDENNINPGSLIIINKCKKILNQKNMNVIIKCIKFRINIIPILYHLGYDDINLLIDRVFFFGNINMLKIINKCIKIYPEILIEHIIWLCTFGSCNIIKYLHKIIKLTNQDFRLNYNDILYLACYHNNINIIKYYHRELGFTKEEFQSNNNEICVKACCNGYNNIVKYLHKCVGINTRTFH